MGKKAATELTFNKIIVLILVILVILGVLMFLFRADILEKIKTLPGYESNPDETINLSEDQMKLLNYTPIGSIASSVKSYKYFSKQYIEIYKLDKDFNKIDSIETRLILESSSGTSQANGDIVIARSWDSSIVIGKMEDNRIIITVRQADYLNYKKQYDALPDYADLLKLNNAKYIGGTLFVTKSLIEVLPPAEQLITLSDIIIPNITQRISYFDGIHYKLNLAPYFVLMDSNSGKFLYLKKNKDSISIYMKTSVNDGDYSDSSLVGKVYPASDTWGRFWFGTAIGVHWVASEKVSLGVQNPSRDSYPPLYQTNLWVDYTQLYSKIHT